MVEGWRGEDSNGHAVRTRHDIVVGTSAFGLGVDMPDVRSVVHACLPETLDRYYQEVGRTGRDGRPSIAYLVTTPADGHLAASLNQRVVISTEKGWDRWQSMRRDAGIIGTGMYEVSLNSCPTNLSEGYDRNRQWNVRTLNLMVWAGLIRLRAPQPPVRSEDEPEAEWTARREAFYDEADARVAVEIIDGATNRPDHWEEVVSAQRSIAKDGQRVALDRMHDVLRGSHCAGEILARYYRAHWQAGVLSTGVNCRSCPWCRANRAADYDAAGMCRVAGEPFPAVHSWPGRGRDPLADVRGSSSWLSIWWGNEQERDDLLPQLLERLVRRGMPVIGGPGVDSTAWLRRSRNRPGRPRSSSTTTMTWSPRSRAGDMGARRRDSVPRTAVILDRLNSTDVTYLLHPASLPAPDRPEIRLAAGLRRIPFAQRRTRSSLMALINERASLPSHDMGGGAVPAIGRRAVPGRTRAGNCCAPRPCCRRDSRTTFNERDRTLKDLGLVTDEGGELSLSPAARGTFTRRCGAASADLLRRAVLGQAQNTGLDGSDDQTRTKDAGAKDLVRALAWFLTLDAFTPLGLDEVTQLQESAFPARLGNPIVNDVRWSRFVYWAPALGFAARSLLDKRALRAADSSPTAPWRSAGRSWPSGRRASASTPPTRSTGSPRSCPCCPGGRYSRCSACLPPPPDVASSLSSALLRGDHEWISLEQPLRRRPGRLPDRSRRRQRNAAGQRDHHHREPR